MTKQTWVLFAGLLVAAVLLPNAAVAQRTVNKTETSTKAEKESGGVSIFKKKDNQAATASEDELKTAHREAKTEVKATKKERKAAEAREAAARARAEAIRAQRRAATADKKVDKAEDKATKARAKAGGN